MEIESSFPLNKILINPFILLDYKSDKFSDVKYYFDAASNKQTGSFRNQIENGYIKGTNELCSFLVRSASQKIFISSQVPKDFPKIEDYLSIFPKSLLQRIEVLDKDGNCANRVKRYLEPIENIDMPLQKNGQAVKDAVYKSIFNFLYKVVLASKVGAEAEFSLRDFEPSINNLIKQSPDDEVNFRLSEIIGISKLYGKKHRIDTISLRPSNCAPSIYERIDELLQRDEILRLSNSRYYLGIPGKSKAALLNMKLRIRSILTSKKYTSELKSACDIIQVIEGATTGIPIPFSSSLELINKLQISAYNPPLINLNSAKMEITKNVYGESNKRILTYMEANPLSVSMTFSNIGNFKDLNVRK